MDRASSPSRLVDVPEEDLGDDFPDGGAVRHELAVHPVQHSLHIVPAHRQTDAFRTTDTMERI